MKRIWAMLIAVIICLSSAFSLFSCAHDQKSPPPTGDGKGGGAEEKEEAQSAIFVPEYRDYGRGTVDFADMSYERPNFKEVISAFDSVTDLISKNEISFEKQLEEIEELEEPYTIISTMASYASLRSSQSIKDEYWNAEYEYISSAYPSFVQAVERTFVAAASSPHSERFENEYFGEGLTKKYRDGGKYTDELVALMEDEADLVSRYAELSHATVEITYSGSTAAFDSISKMLADKYGKNSKKYKKAIEECELLYEAALEETSADILVELFKLRARIGDELGDGGYVSYAYESIYHDYTAEDYLAFARDIRKYILPVYTNLSSSVFSQYDYTSASKLGTAELINGTAEMLRETDEELYSVYCYMLQHGLYDVSPLADDRFEGAFTTYLELYSAPFLFFSTEGTVFDCSTLCHEFGHFIDAYFNYNSETSLDLSEISSQALELMATARLDGIVSEKDIQLMKISLVESALSTLLFQSFYAVFEHIAYSIPAENISRETLNAAVIQAANAMGLRSDAINDISFVLIPHIFRYPFYVQSYCTSAAVSLEIYFAELKSEGAGFEIYKELITREEGGLTFEEYLTEAGLTSPFEVDYLKGIANGLCRLLADI